MKISKSILKAMAVASVVSVSASSCQKELDVAPCVKKIIEKKDKKDTPPEFECPACGMG